MYLGNVGLMLSGFHDPDNYLQGIVWRVFTFPEVVALNCWWKCSLVRTKIRRNRTRKKLSMFFENEAKYLWFLLEINTRNRLVNRDALILNSMTINIYIYCSIQIVLLNCLIIWIGHKLNQSFTLLTSTCTVEYNVIATSNRTKRENAETRWSYCGSGRLRTFWWHFISLLILDE